ncbi:hypothetical protein [Aeromonas dhakensis]|uniref:hypothetical protein n=1 Tax=Aeromonas dhakensis TaxID=196024 RepID=UPI003B9F2E09
MDSINEYIKLLITPVPWIIAFFISYVTFRKNDISRQKDKILSLIEKLFDELIEIIGNGKGSEEELDSFLSYKSSIIEIQINSIESRARKKIVDRNQYAIIRSLPIDLLKKRINAEARLHEKEDESIRLERIQNTKTKINNELFDLSILIISDIENNYNSWFFKKWLSFPRANFKKHHKTIMIILISFIVGWLSRNAFIKDPIPYKRNSYNNTQYNESEKKPPA